MHPAHDECPFMAKETTEQWRLEINLIDSMQHCAVKLSNFLFARSPIEELTGLSILDQEVCLFIQLPYTIFMIESDPTLDWTRCNKLRLTADCCCYCSECQE